MSESTLSADRRAPSILLIEDDEMLSESLTMVLNDAGYRVQRAHCGQRALTLLCEYVPELLILDYSLNDMTAEELLARVDPRLRVQTILLTGHAHGRALGQQLGVAAVLDKPFVIATFENIVATTIARFNPNIGTTCSITNSSANIVDASPALR